MLMSCAVNERFLASKRLGTEKEIAHAFLLVVAASSVAGGTPNDNLLD